MLFFEFPEFLSVLILLSPTIVHRLVSYSAWKREQNLKGQSGNYLTFQWTDMRKFNGLPFRQHRRYWTIQIGVIALLFAPLDWLGGKL